MEKKIFPGKKMGYLTAIERVENMGKMPRWKCKCKCGREVIEYSFRLNSGFRLSCGCANGLETAFGCHGEKCRFFDHLNKCCDYASRMGVTRSKLHQGEDVDINNPCREFQPEV